MLTCSVDVWRPLPDWLGGEQPYDLNSWQESETALQLADTLEEDAVIVEGYAEYATWRPHLAYLRDPYGDPDMEMEIDGVGGVSILAKARVFRAGVHFPAFSFEKHAETEGFGKVRKNCTYCSVRRGVHVFNMCFSMQMARRMNFSVVGLPHYTIWHLYEPSVDDIKHMEVSFFCCYHSWMFFSANLAQQMEKERVAKEKEEKEKAEYMKVMKQEFADTGAQWEKDKAKMQQIAAENKKKESGHKEGEMQENKSKDGSEPKKNKVPDPAAGETEDK